MSQASFAKRQREKARSEKAAEKAAKKAERRANAEAEAEEAGEAPPVDEQALIGQLAKLHASFDDGDIDFESFMEAKEEITEKLQGN